MMYLVSCMDTKYKILDTKYINASLDLYDAISNYS